MRTSETLLLDFIRQSPQFRIPVNQRRYAWTRRHCRQLWDDILDAGERQDVREHFLGPIMYVAAVDPLNAHWAPCLVYDGQQRLSTVTPDPQGALPAPERRHRAGRLRARPDQERVSRQPLRQGGPALSPGAQGGGCGDAAGADPRPPPAGRDFIAHHGCPRVLRDTHQAARPGRLAAVRGLAQAPHRRLPAQGGRRQPAPNLRDHEHLRPGPQLRRHDRQLHPDAARPGTPGTALRRPPAAHRTRLRTPRRRTLRCVHPRLPDAEDGRGPEAGGGIRGLQDPCPLAPGRGRRSRGAQCRFTQLRRSLPRHGARRGSRCGARTGLWRARPPRHEGGLALPPPPLRRLRGKASLQA